MVRLGYEDMAVAASATASRGSGTARRGGRSRGRKTYGRSTYADATQEPTVTLASDSDEAHPSLFKSLTKLEALLNTAEASVLKEREAHELSVRKSISDKQDSRTKSGAVLKGTELEEIAKAVRASETKTIDLSPNIDFAKKRVSDILAEVGSLQSAERKAANAILKVSVPEIIPMNWVNLTDTFSGW